VTTQNMASTSATDESQNWCQVDYWPRSGN
jgi:hypothetical protein